MKMINIHTKKLLILSVAVLSLCLLYGCGKKTNETESIASPSPTQSVTETPATGNAQTSDSEQSPDSSSTAPANTDDSSADSNAGASSTAPAATDNSSADSNTGASSVTSGVSNDEMAELARLYAATLDGMKPIETLHLPASSSEYSDILASEALSMCSQGGKSQMTKFLTSSGFEILLQANYDKSPSDPSHTCAFTLAKKKIFHNGTDRDLLVISIRGTESGEWFSNFDFAPSHSDDAIFAENFL
ncbi:MAG: hypothetical protein J6Y89_09865, partial [Lachnospiraceae bacterium]|nr:hypothetical protein [Lachnospiraceae bacterium]